MADEENRFEPRLGRPGNGRGRSGRARSMQSQLIGRIARAGGDWRMRSLPPGRARQSGRFNARGRGAKLSHVGAGSSGWSFDPISRMRVRARRVMVKARVVKLSGVKAAGAAQAHLRYLQRDGVTREGEQGRFYSTFSDDANGKAFLERGAGDRHQFRFIVSPEDGSSFDTLRSFTRELMAKMEQDLGTTLDWVAVDHFDTGHPHTHLLVRGVTEDGKVLNIAGDYIAHGIRGRASEIMTRWLGPQSELEVREQLEREIGAERLTKLDRDIIARTDDHVVDLRQPARWDGDGSYQQLPLPLSQPRASHACVRTIRDHFRLRNALRMLKAPAKLTRVTKRNSTIDDVAQAAGVARVTVSRVLNNVGNVRSATRERVLRAVEELGYSVNQQARALASGSGRQVMLIHAHNPKREPNSYYNAGLELGALRACSPLGFDLVTRAIDPDDENPSRLLASIIERDGPRGIIVTPPLSDDPELLNYARNAGVRMVAISAGERTRAIVSSVGIDERAGGRTIAEYLLALGHRRFGFVQGPPEHRSATLRFDGFVDALRDAGAHEDPWTATGDFTFKSGVEATERLLRDKAPITALACANDDMAAGAMLALHRAGLEIPSGMSVSGFDDTPMSEVVWPPLTTVRQPIKFIAERAVQMLFEVPADGDETVHYEVIPHELVLRESTAPPNPFRGA